MHGHLMHRHPARGLGLSEDTTLENNDSLANIVERADANKDGLATVYSVVYVTASATFSGPTAGYVTMGLSSTASSGAAKSSGTTSQSSASATTTARSTLTKSASAASTSSASSQSTPSKSSSSAQSTTSFAASTTSSAASSSSSSSSSLSSTSLANTALAEATSSSSASASATPSPGLSSGAKGGIAFAVILALALVAGLGFFFYRRKKSQQGTMGEAQRLADDEKRPSPPAHDLPAPVVAARASSPRNEAPAPRLSIRPTSRFSLGADPEKAAAALSAISQTSPKKSAWDRRGNQATDPENPFGIHAETVNAPTTNPAASQSTVSFELEGSAVPGASSEAAPATPPKSAASSDFPLSASTTEFGTAAAVPVVAAAGAAGAAGAAPPNGNVHRVQLEFKPSMDDELELKVGNLVRVLHEYDDGWALCMTMDRSKQGVAPRTCVSKLPLKPRPTGPPPGRAMGAPPPGPAMRKVSEPPRPNSLVPAPLSPSVQSRSVSGQSQAPRQRTASGPGPLSSPPTRSMSPAPSASKPMADARRRSASVGSVTPTKPSSPASSSPLKPAAVPARKPVPGQAL